MLQRGLSAIADLLVLVIGMFNKSLFGEKLHNSQAKVPFTFLVSMSRVRVLE